MGLLATEIDDENSAVQHDVDSRSRKIYHCNIQVLGIGSAYDNDNNRCRRVHCRVGPEAYLNSPPDSRVSLHGEDVLKLQQNHCIGEQDGNTPDHPAGVADLYIVSLRIQEEKVRVANLVFEGKRAAWKLPHVSCIPHDRRDAVHQVINNAENLHSSAHKGPGP